MTEHSTRYLKDLIKTKGKITFAEFTEIALYHENFGYYNNSRPKIGTDGDFYTSPDVHHFPGRVLARQLKEMWTLLDETDFSIIEMGAGKGVMALDILNAIKNEANDFYQHCTYIIIEKSSSFKTRQKDLLIGHEGKVKWVDSLHDMKQSHTVTGCVLSNELVDAFPFHRVYQDVETLKEIYVTLKDDNFVEEISDISTDKLREYIDRLKISLPDGMKTEINLEAMRWINDVAGILNKGFVITIDYGHPAYLYYAPTRTDGTFLCYYNHSTNETPYERIGLQDITAHVDFTSLAIEGKNCGLELVAFTEMWAFLIECGKDILEDEMGRLQNLDRKISFKTTSAIKNLIHPEGMGGKFKVLIQTKNVNTPYMVETHFNKKHLLEIQA